MAAALVVLFTVAAVLVTRRQRRRVLMGPQLGKSSAQLNPVYGQSTLADAGSIRAVPRNCVELVSQLGKGNFGEVWKAVLDESSVGGPPEHLVAAKMVVAGAPSQEVDALIEEGIMMATVSGHPNVVSVVGLVRGDGPELPTILLLTYAEHGSLLRYVRSTPDAVSPAFVAKVGRDVAAGMAHLVCNGIVHRDLAARNILVSSNLTLRIADFGLSRVGQRGKGDDNSLVYESRELGTLPVRWTAPEIFRRDGFSPASDVWAFAVLVYEVLTAGAIPYSHMPEPLKVVTEVIRGYRLQQPPGCPDPLYALLLRCWEGDPTKRPGFDELHDQFTAMVAAAITAAPGAPAEHAAAVDVPGYTGAAAALMAAAGYDGAAAALDSEGYVGMQGGDTVVLDGQGYVGAPGVRLDGQTYVNAAVGGGRPVHSDRDDAARIQAWLEPPRATADEAEVGRSRARVPPPPLLMRRLHRRRWQPLTRLGASACARDRHRE